MPLDVLLSDRIINASLSCEVLSYNFEVDEKLSAFILKNNSRRIKILGIKLPEIIWRKDKSIIWINNPQYRFDIVPLELYNKIFLKGVPVFISSCSRELVPFFVKNNFEAIKVGREAILEMNKYPFQKKSLIELIKSGQRNGTIEEISYSDENALLLEEFKKQCVHGQEPQLKYFFNDSFVPASRLFVYKDGQRTWQGGITIVTKEDGKVITELILRRKNSPRGTMEALVFSIFKILLEEGAISWSLGEVPYIVYHSKFFSKEFFINYTGRLMKFAYNYLGLYNFKNKFSPRWNDVYICCKPKLTITTLLKISWRSNMLKLILEKPFIKLSDLFNKR